MQVLFETLEGRNLFSVVPVVLPTIQEASVLALTATPMAALTQMVGKWTGKLSVVGVHSKPATVTIKKQSATGKLSGLLTTAADASIKVALSGKIKASGIVTIKLNGGHSGGAINGTGKGKVSANGKTIKFTMTWLQGSLTFPGSITLARA